jgi:hypothetical protein
MFDLHGTTTYVIPTPLVHPLLTLQLEMLVNPEYRTNKRMHVPSLLHDLVAILDTAYEGFKKTYFDPTSNFFFRLERCKTYAFPHYDHVGENNPEFALRETTPQGKYTAFVNNIKKTYERFCK